jgi:hypothetical protein
MPSVSASRLTKSAAHQAQLLDCKARRGVAADRAHDTADFVADCRQRNVTPHVAMNMTGVFPQL